MRDIYICFTVDNSYVPYCGVAISSIVKNKSVEDRLHIYILCRKLHEGNKKKLLALSIGHECEIQVIDMPADLLERLKDAPMPPKSHNNAVETYFRIFIPELLYDRDRILYLDCDIVVRQSLADLFFMDMQGQLLAMVRDICWKATKHFNSGVILINCEKWRKEQIGDQLIEFMQDSDNRKRFTYHDQDLINFVLWDKVCKLNPKWNRFVLLERFDRHMVKKDDAVLHFITDVKPWHGVYQNELVDEYFDYLNHLSWGIKDIRKRAKCLDVTRYYEARWMLIDLTAKKRISTESELILLSALDSASELVCAAMDMGFHKLQNMELGEIPLRISEKACVVIESYFDFGIKMVLERLGYKSGRHYHFLKRKDAEAIEKELLGAIQPYQKGRADMRLNIIIYGTANWAVKFTEILARCGVDIMFYADSSSEKWGEAFYGKEIISPEQLKEVVDENTIIVIASSAFTEIRRGLIKIGIDKGRILVFKFM